jgi:hypothetical protein
MKNYSEIFSSLKNLSDTINSRKMNEVFVNAKREDSNTNDSIFTGTKSYEESDKLMLSGDSTNLDKLESVKGIDVTKIAGVQKRNICTKSIAGGFPIVPVYLAGVPKNMMAAKKIETKSKVISLIYNKSVDCSIPAENIINAGAKLVSIIKYIESKGIRINLYLASKTIKNGQILSFAIKIKDSGAPLNVLNIAYPLINPSIIRRQFLKFIETCPIEIDKYFPYGYGHPTEIIKTDDICKKIGTTNVLSFSEINNKSTDEIANQLIDKIRIK